MIPEWVTKEGGMSFHSSAGTAEECSQSVKVSVACWLDSVSEEFCFSWRMGLSMA